MQFRTKQLFGWVLIISIAMAVYAYDSRSKVHWQALSPNTIQQNQEKKLSTLIYFRHGKRRECCDPEFLLQVPEFVNVVRRHQIECYWVDATEVGSANDKLRRTFNSYPSDFMMVLILPGQEAIAYDASENFWAQIDTDLIQATQTKRAKK